MKRLVLVGGGHSHVEVIRRFGLDPLERAEIVLVSPDRFTPYSGMLPGLVAGHYTHAACHIDLDALTAFARVRFERDAVVGLDPSGGTIRCASGRRHAFDVVSLDIGSARTHDLLHPDADHGVPVKPTEHFLAAWDAILARAREERLRIVTIGAGAAGVELTLAMQHRLHSAACRPAQFVIVSAGDRILSGHHHGVRRRFERVLRERRIDVRMNSSIARVDGRSVQMESGTQIDADWVVWAHGPQASGWIADSGLGVDAQGFALVDEHLRSVTHANVFAAGDIASMRGHPRPKSGVYAVRQGPPLAANLRAALIGASLSSYLPQRKALALISTGDRHAVASRGAFSVEGAWVWRWKDIIDRRFMRRYRVG